MKLTCKLINFNAEFLVFDTQFLVFDTQFLVFDTKFIILTHGGCSALYFLPHTDAVHLALPQKS